MSDQPPIAWKVFVFLFLGFSRYFFGSGKRRGYVFGFSLLFVLLTHVAILNNTIFWNRNGF
jgi:hypothetical protein